MHGTNKAVHSTTAGGGVAGVLGMSTSRTQLVLLDFGLAEELTPQVRHHFISFLTAICAGSRGLVMLGTSI
jgi:aarF domain-containing kinase